VSGRAEGRIVAWCVVDRDGEPRTTWTTEEYATIGAEAVAVQLPERAPFRVLPVIDPEEQT